MNIEFAGCGCRYVVGDTAVREWIGKMRGCYADRLGDCRGGLSREHYVTEAVLELLGDTHRLSNTAWMTDGDRARDSSAADLCARVLCEGHNSDLASLDRVGVEFCRFLLDGLFDERPVTTPRLLTLDGMALERWVLKAVTGAFAGGCVKMPGRISWVPPQSWVEHLFGRSSCIGLGLCFVNAPLEPSLGFEMVPLHMNEQVTGGNFWFNGLKMAIVPDGVHPTKIGDGECEPFDLIPRPDRIRIVKGRREFVLMLLWPSVGHEGREVVYTATASIAKPPVGISRR